MFWKEDHANAVQSIATPRDACADIQSWDSFTHFWAAAGAPQPEQWQHGRLAREFQQDSMAPKPETHGRDARATTPVANFAQAAKASG